MEYLHHISKINALQPVLLNTYEGLFLPACAHVCLADRVGLHTGCWCGQFPTTVVWPLIQFLPSQLSLSTPQWLIRKVSGISLSAGRGRGWKYLQSSQEGISLGVDFVVSRLLSLRADRVGVLRNLTLNVKSCGNQVKYHNDSDNTNIRQKLRSPFTYYLGLILTNAGRVKQSTYSNGNYTASEQERLSLWQKKKKNPRN